MVSRQSGCGDGHIGGSHMRLELTEVVVNRPVADSVFLMKLKAPDTCDAVQPGQFINIRVPGDTSELLRLPFSVYWTDTQNGTIEILYQVLGSGTRRLSKLVPGDVTDFIGPIGHGWSIPGEGGRTALQDSCATYENALLVGGGLGIAPLLMLAQRLHALGTHVEFVMGAPTRARLLGRDRMECFGEVYVATDDGSEGHAGFCTDIVGEALQEKHYDYIATCGPGPMEAIVARQARSAGVFCEVSLERMMACGIGACLSCVVDTTAGKRRVCVDGPVFPAEEVVW